MPEIKKILVANRGEIALRIIRTCKDLGIKTVAVYSDADTESPHVLAADESVHIGKSASSDSYLVIEKIIEAVNKTGADAVHPGYGFLSENAGFAKACQSESVIFIGPDPEAIRLMGDKTKARELMKLAGVPYPPGTESALQHVNEAKNFAEEIGFPVLIKAAAGGGGKGMRIVRSVDEFDSGVKAAKSEAESAFGDDRVYVEKYLESPRHIEFQILADTHGNIVHLFDRECSIQRRHQKVIEEAPSSLLTPELRRSMAEAAVAAAKACKYTGAGTIEFLVDKNMDFYFLEMNTRLQVEHPVTELITGVDLVEMQIHVAEGKKLPFTQSDISRNGHAIECRIYAEDPSDNFLPSTGVLTKHRPAEGPWIRVDSGVEEGQKITINYDPMISKLCTVAPTRIQAINRMKRALEDYEISGCRTTIPFCEFVMNHEDFQNAEYDTHFIKEKFTAGLMNSNGSENTSVIPVVASLLTEQLENQSNSRNQITEYKNPGNSNWWKNRR
jgi:acetyl-CoA carboxylase, biotin carboxylase subunit